MAGSVVINFITSPGSSQAWACRGIAKGCPQTRFSLACATRHGCLECLQLTEKDTIGTAVEKLTKGDA